MTRSNPIEFLRLRQPKDVRSWTSLLSGPGSIEPAALAAVTKIPTTRVSIKRNSVWPSSSEVSEHVHVIMSGAAANLTLADPGRRHIGPIFIPGDACDLYEMILPAFKAQWIALVDTEMLLIPHALLRTIARESVSLTEALWRRCAIDQEMSRRSANVLATRDAEGRLAHLLCELSKRYERIGHPRDRFPLPMVQLLIGDATGQTAVHLNRVVRSLREARLIAISDFEVRVFDWDGLARVAGFDAGYLHLH